MSRSDPKGVVSATSTGPATIPPPVPRPAARTLTLVRATCPVCGRAFDFAEPVTLARDPGRSLVWATADADELPRIAFAAPEGASDARIAGLLAERVCALLTKYTGHRITSHYRRY